MANEEKIRNYLLDPGKLPCGGFRLGGGIVYDEETKTVGIPTVYIAVDESDESNGYISTLDSFEAPMFYVYYYNLYDKYFKIDLFNKLSKGEFSKYIVEPDESASAQDDEYIVVVDDNELLHFIMPKDKRKVHIDGIPVPMYKVEASGLMPDK